MYLLLPQQALLPQQTPRSLSRRMNDEIKRPSHYFPSPIASAIFVLGAGPDLKWKVARWQGICAVCYTDFWSAYELVFPDSRHKSVGKETGLTAYIERLNNTLRQRISRLVRKTLSFSKKLITI